MKRRSIFHCATWVKVCGAFALLGSLTAAGATQSDESAVLLPFQAVLDGLAHHDRSLIIRQLLPGGGATLMREDRPVQLSFDTFADRLAGAPADVLERMYDPLIRIDGNVAVVWSGYDLTIGGKLDHCGSDLISLVKVDGKWLIASLADTSRKACPPRK